MFQEGKRTWSFLNMLIQKYNNIIICNWMNAHSLPLSSGPLYLKIIAYATLGNLISSHNIARECCMIIDFVCIRICEYYIIITKVEAHISCAFISDCWFNKLFWCINDQTLGYSMHGKQSAKHYYDSMYILKFVVLFHHQRSYNYYCRYQLWCQLVHQLSGDMNSLI